jgi:transposase
LPIAGEITAGEVSDYTGFEPLMEAEGPAAKVLLADRGYDSDHIRETPQEKGAAATMPTRRSHQIQIPVDGYIYTMHNRIKQCFNKLENSRRLATRYDKPLPTISGSSKSPLSGFGCAHLSTVPSFSWSAAPSSKNW